MDAMTERLIREAEQITKASQARGLIDPDKLIAASERLQRLIDRENAARGKRLKQLEDTQETLRRRSDELTAVLAEEAEKTCVIEATILQQDLSIHKPLKLKAPRRIP